ncbi:MAG: nitroreductase [Deltaproteobacteria bacterium]|nr:nitroreductase [Deltaproteobacteria bacterium]
MNIIEAIRTRKSIRDFTTDPVPQHILKKIIEVASRAPSAENSQPWEFTVVAGKILDTIRKANIEKLKSKAPLHPDLPAKGLPRDSVYRRRQIEIAKQLFALMDIPREDLEKRDRWMELGFRYFNAPAAIIISMDRSLNYPRPIFDIGSVTQTICLAALHYDLGTCIANQGISYPEVLHEFAKIPESKRIVISIAIGYPNWDFPANKVVSNREPVENIIRWIGFE